MIRILFITVVFLLQTVSTIAQYGFSCNRYIVRMNGTSSYMVAQYPLALHPVSHFSFAFWMRKETNDLSRPMTLISRWEDACSYALTIGTDGQLKFTTVVDGSPRQGPYSDTYFPGPSRVPDSIVTSGLSLDSGKFYHIAFTYDTTSLVGTIYVNGQIVGSKKLMGKIRITFTFAHDPVYCLGANMILYNGGYSFGNYFKGYMDEVAIGDQVLQKPQIDSIAAGNLPSDFFQKYGLYGWWKLEEGSGTTSVNGTGLTFSNNPDDKMYLNLVPWVKLTCPPVNKPPVSSPGPDQTITLPTNSATLDGSLSYDPDGTIISYRWTLLSSPITGGGNITTPNNKITTITSLNEGTYIYQLTVTDNQGATGTSKVTITVKSLTIKLLNPNPSIVQADGSLNTNIANLDTTDIVVGAATDGISKVLIYGYSSVPVTFTINGINNGTLASLSNQTPDPTSPTTIKIIPDANNKIVAVYTPPDGFGPFNNSSVSRQITITASDGNSLKPITFQLITPPVVLVHGMWSSPFVWLEGDFVKSLSDAGYHYNFMGNQIDLASIYLADYSDYSASTFDPLSQQSFYGRRAIQKAIRDALTNYHQNFIAAAQADIVGHSLGGLMARSFSQQSDFRKDSNYYKGSFHKLITLGTPHKGSPFGPLLYYDSITINLFTYQKTVPGRLQLFMKSLGKPIGLCHKDFDENGPVILNNLLTTPPYYTYSIGGDYRGSISDSIEYSDFNALVYILSGKTHAELFHIDGCPNAEPDNDIIVPMYSQIGGSKLAQIFPAAAHLEIIPFTGETSETNSGQIQNKVIQLLSSNVAVQFNKGFVKASTINNDCDRPTITNRILAPGTKSPANVAKALGTNNHNQAVQITSPTIGATYNQNSKATITLKFTALNGASPIRSIFMIQDIGWFTPSDHVSNSVSFTLPVNAALGDKNIVLLVRDTSGIILADTSHITITADGVLDSLSVDPKTVHLDSLYREQSAHVHGYFTNTNSATIIDNNLTDQSTGTNYSAKHGGIFTTKENGLIIAQKPGVDTLIISNNGKNISVPVIIDTNFAMATLYPNVIDFTLIPDKVIGAAPFGIVASTTSGDDVGFTLVSGGAIIQNGIVTINTPGKVTVKASASGNAYFSSAQDVVKSFCVDPLPAKSIVGDTTTCATTKTYYFSRDSSISYNDSLIFYNWNIIGGTILGQSEDSVTVRWDSTGLQLLKITPNAGGCLGKQLSINVHVTMPAQTPVITPSGPTSFCNGDSIVLSTQYSGNLQWNKDGIPIAGANHQSYTATMSGKYSLTALNGNCSATSQTVIVNVNSLPPTPVVNASGALNFCYGDSVFLYSSAQNNYKWYRNDTLIASATQSSYTVKQSGVYSVQIAQSGCTAISSPVTVSVVPIPISPSITISGQLSFCSGDSLTLISSANSGNQWYKNGNTIASAINRTYTVKDSGSYTVKTTANGCSSPSSNAIVPTIIQLPNGSITTTSTDVCPGGNVQLSASGGNSYQWYKDSQQITGATATNYTATVSGVYTADIISNGCEAKASNSITITVLNKPKTAFSFDSYCLNLPVTFINTTSGSNINYQWNFGDNQTSVSTSPQHTYSKAGTYTVSLIASLKNCLNNNDTLQKTIRIETPVTGIKYAVVPGVYGRPQQLSARNIGKAYQWIPPTDLNNSKSRTPVITPTADRKYAIQITTPSGCITTDSLEVALVKDINVLVPTAFAPNGNGSNDLLRPILLNITSIKYFKVYNRWGQLLYETRTINEGWDGNYQGKSQPMETYTWIFEGIDIKGNPVKASGKSVLIR